MGHRRPGHGRRHPAALRVAGVRAGRGRAALLVVSGLLSVRVAWSGVALEAVPDLVRRAVLIGVDLGPNLSVTGSLATILWLTALRPKGHGVGTRAFLKLGALVMPPALPLALAAATLVH